MKVAVVEYNAGNIRSVLFALKRLGVEAEVTQDHQKIRLADKVIFPGVGEASSAMRFLRARGLDAVLSRLAQPLLGICLGLQLLCEHSEENNTNCLGIFPEKVVRFKSSETQKFKIPHMGWNSIYDLKGGLFRQIDEKAQVYFVHSYYAAKGPDTAASCDYAAGFSAALVRDNFHAVQFHPEKSGVVGERILKNFIEL